MSVKNGETNLAGDPDQLPTDVDEIGKMLGEEEQIDDNAQAQGDSSTTTVTPVKTDDAAVKTPASEVKKDDAAKQEPEVAGVLTKDGKNFIPYSAHQGLRAERDAERRARVDAERKAEEAALRSAELASQIETLKKAATDQAAGTATQAQIDEAEEVLKSLDEAEMPVLANALRAINASSQGQIAKLKQTVEALTAKQTEVNESMQAAQASVVQSRQQMADEAFDHNPKLRYLHDKHPAIFKQAEELDALMGQSSGFNEGERNVEFYATRYNAVVAALEAKMGKAIELPADYLSDQDVLRIANAKVKDAGTFKPKTLSDFPGGTTPNSKPVVDDMSAAQMYGATETFNEDQWNSFLRNTA